MGRGPGEQRGCDEGGKEGNEGSTVSEKQRENGDNGQQAGEEDNEVWNEDETRRVQREPEHLKADRRRG